MLTSTAVAAYIDELLDTAGTPDYPNALNGLQLENRSPIRGIAAAVDFSTRAVQGAIESGANFLIVHHGIFWGGLTPFSGPLYRILRTVIENDIAVYSSHLPLDRHVSLSRMTSLSILLICLWTVTRRLETTCSWQRSWVLHPQGCSHGFSTFSSEYGARAT